MSMLNALCSDQMRGEAAKKVVHETARDAMAADAIAKAADSGNEAADGFVSEASGRLREAKVRRARADRLRAKSADATAMGEHKLAAFGSDMATLEDLKAAELESSVVESVRAAYGASPFYMSDKESQLMKQGDFLQQTSGAGLEKAFSSLLDKTLADAANYGRDGIDDEEIFEDEGPAERIGVAAEIFGGDLQTLLGEDVFGKAKVSFKASREKLQKRLAARKASLAKLKEAIESGKKVPMAKRRLNGLKKSISRIEAKLKKLGVAEQKVQAAQVDGASIESAEAEALSELQELDSEEDEVEPFELDEESSEPEPSAEDEGEFGWAPRPWRGRGWGPRAGRRGGRPWGRGWVGPVVQPIVQPVVIVSDDEDEDEDLLEDILGADHSDVLSGDDSDLLPSTNADVFNDFFTTRSVLVSERFGAGGQPIASVVEAFGSSGDDMFSGVVDSVLDFFSNLFSTTKSKVQSLPRPGYNAPRRPAAKAAPTFSDIREKARRALPKKLLSERTQNEMKDSMEGDDSDLVEDVLGQDDVAAMSEAEEAVNEPDLDGSAIDEELSEDDFDLELAMKELGV